MRALLLFCEGKHEVELLRRLLHEDRKCGWGEHKAALKDYPEPLAGFLMEKLTSRADVSERKLSELSQHDPPQLAYVNRRHDQGDPALVLLYRMQGEGQKIAVITYIKELINVLKTNAQGFTSQSSQGRERVTSWSIGLLLDADNNAKRKLDDWGTTLKSVLGDVRLNDGDWSCSSSDVRIGALLLRGTGQDTGTLESILEGAIVEQFRTTLPIVQEFLQAHKPVRSELFRGKDPVAQRARLLKASFVVLGQYDRPDQGLPTIIGHSDLFDTDALAHEPSLVRLVNFIAAGCMPDSQAREETPPS